MIVSRVLSFVIGLVIALSISVCTESSSNIDNVTYEKILALRR